MIKLRVREDNKMGIGNEITTNKVLSLNGYPFTFESHRYLKSVQINGSTILWQFIDLIVENDCQKGFAPSRGM